MDDVPDITQIVAPEYSSSATYEVGDYVIYGGGIYRCTTAITTGEAWTSGHWTAVVLGADLASQVSDLKTDIIDLKNATSNYIIKSVLPFSVIDDSAITPSSDVSGLINREGTVVSSTVYKIATFNVTEDCVYKISHQTGSSFANIRSIEILKDNNVIEYIYPASNAIEIHYITNFTGSVRVCYRAQNANSLKIFTQKSALEAEYNTFKNGFVDPDDYSGTDSEKIQAAMAEIGDTGHGVILIKRKFTLTASINISHGVDENKRIIFVGTGKDSGFDMGPYRFKSIDQNKSYGMISFENLYFTGTGVLFASEYLLRVTFSNCILYGGTNAVRNNRYMQSWTFNVCTFRDFTHYIIYSVLPTQDNPNVSMYDVAFNECLIERCAGFIYTNRLLGVSIMQCCIEALTGYVCNVVTQARDLCVIGNYFEHNNNRIPNPDYETDPTQPRYIGNGGKGVHFVFSSLVGNLSTITIASNSFVTSIYSPDTENDIILLPVNRPKIGHIIVENNDISYGSNIYLVKAHNSATDIYNNVLLSGNSNSNYNGGENNLLFDSHKANLGVVNSVASGTELSSLSQPGVYFVDSDATVSDRPSSGDCFVINIRGDDGTAQIAITSVGLKSRINDGEWS